MKEERTGAELVLSIILAGVLFAQKPPAAVGPFAPPYVVRPEDVWCM